MFGLVKSEICWACDEFLAMPKIWWQLIFTALLLGVVLMMPGRVSVPTKVMQRIEPLPEATFCDVIL